MTDNQHKKFDKLIEALSKLDEQDRDDLVEQFDLLIQRKLLSQKKNRSLLELQGLGKELWESIDIEEYINAERDSWD